MFVLQDHLRSLYAPHILYASEADYNDLNVEKEPEFEPRSFADIQNELLDEIRKLVVNQTTKVDADAEPDVDKPKLEPELEVVDEPDSESEVKDPLIVTHVDLPVDQRCTNMH